MNLSHTQHISRFFGILGSTKGELTSPLTIWADSCALVAHADECGDLGSSGGTTSLSSRRPGQIGTFYIFSGGVG